MNTSENLRKLKGNSFFRLERIFAAQDKWNRSKNKDFRYVSFGEIWSPFLEQNEYWMNADGEIIPIAHMSREYRVNALRLLENHAGPLRIHDETLFTDLYNSDLTWLVDKPLAKALLK